jgi:predicted kinase
MIEVLCGTIASGKSTWAKNRAEEGCIIVNDDAIVNAVHGGIYTLYKEYLKPLYKSIEDHIFHTAIAMGKGVVIDKGLSLSVASRQRWIALGHSLDVPVHAVIFEFFDAEIHGRRRTEDDPRGWDLAYWTKVAQAHIDRYEIPTVEEGFDTVVTQRWS